MGWLDVRRIEMASTITGPSNYRLLSRFFYSVPQCKQENKICFFPHVNSINLNFFRREISYTLVCSYNRMSMPVEERLDHKTVRIIKSGRTTFTVIEKEEEGNGLLIQHTSKPMVPEGTFLTKDDLLHYKDEPFWWNLRMALLLLLWLAIIGLTGGAIYLVVASRLACQPESWVTGWWKHSLIYQINVKSFQDTNDDGVGNLAGITSRLDYIQSIGANTILLNPIFAGVNGNSMAVTDFKQIDPSVGSIHEFDELVREAHARNMTIVMDFIVTHTARDHPWFTASEVTTADLAVEGVSTRDFYVWHDGHWDSARVDQRGQPIPGPPNDWKNMDDGRTSAWTWSGPRRQYHYHQTAAALPTLNLASENLKASLDDALRYWLQHDVDGFRFLNFKNAFTGPWRYGPDNNVSGPGLPAESTSLLRRWRRLMDQPSFSTTWTSSSIKHQKVLIVDGDGLSTAELGAFGVNLIFHRNLMKWDSTVKNPGQVMAGLVDTSLRLTYPKTTNCWAIGNLDEHRAVSRMASLELLDAANIIYLLLPGAAVAFYGDEMGLKDRFLSSDKRTALLDGPQITPMLWSTGALAGFTNASSSWIPISRPHDRVADVKSQLRASRSHLKVFQKLGGLRQTDAILFGSYRTAVVSQYMFSFIRQTKSGSGYLIMADLRRNGVVESNPITYSLSSAQLSGTGHVVLGSVTLYSPKNKDHTSLAFHAGGNATVDLASSIVLRESEAVVIQFSGPILT